MEDDEMILTGRAAELVLSLSQKYNQTPEFTLEKALECYEKPRSTQRGLTTKSVIPNASVAKRNE